ncbi:uncharacterized protein LOC110988898 [Acanthaster planci]|uniref:Uncharacterized protein LOC110988898 n=1 Tax=Acanthaster planci TaxID=133434 RepID=A0A8B7ZTY7_ACAPL|nr:uncharacterized protein LOC110988898 [Acanthaster planci]
MKLLALFVCVAFLYGVSSETSDLGDGATVVAADDATDDRAVAVESDDFTEDDDTAEMDDEADLEWDDDQDDDQTDDDLDEEPAFPLMYEDQDTDALETATSPDPEVEGHGRFKCRGRRCCLSRRRFHVCVRASYRQGKIRYKATINKKHVVRKSFKVGANQSMRCIKIRRGWSIFRRRRRVCVGLTSIRVLGKGSCIRHISARVKVQVKGPRGFTRKSKRIRLYRRR